MANCIYVDGVEVNIQDTAVVTQIHRIYEDRKAKKATPELTCTKPHRGPMYLMKRKPPGGIGEAILWAAHMPGHGDSNCSIRIGNEGPAHRNAKEYTAKALERHGFAVELEHSTGNGTVLDVAVLDAPVKLGIEAQFYALDPADARARTTKSVNGGYMPAWMPGSNGLAQKIGYSVPMLRPHTEIDWAAAVPRLGTVHVLSKRHMTLEPCTASGPFTSCPDSGRGMCGKWHPFFAPSESGFQVLDEVLGELAEGTTVPLMDHRGIVYLTSTADKTLYESHTGLSADYRAASKKPAIVSVPRDHIKRIECRADRAIGEPVTSRPASLPLPARLEPVRPRYIEWCQRHGRPSTTCLCWDELVSATRRGFTLPTGYGRCTACGFHTPTQGHRHGCPNRKAA